MKFRFYITNTFNGSIEGTDEQTKAEELAMCEEYYVVDTESGEWISTVGRVPVEEHE